jgi:hypothetical protein
MVLYRFPQLTVTPKGVKMKRFHHLFIASVLIMLLTSASLAGDMHSDSTSPALQPTPLPAQVSGDPKAPDPEDVAVEYLDTYVEMLGIMLNALSAF